MGGAAVLGVQMLMLLVLVLLLVLLLVLVQRLCWLPERVDVAGRGSRLWRRWRPHHRRSLVRQEQRHGVKLELARL